MVFHIRKTHEKFVEEVEMLGLSEYEVLGKYEHSHTPILIRHKSCGNEYYVQPSNFLSGQRCPICSRKEVAARNSFSTEQFKQRIKDLVGDEYILLSEYINKRTKVTIQHRECGYIWSVLPQGLLKHPHCPNCPQPRKSRLTHDEFLGRFDFPMQSKYEILSLYTISADHVRVRCRDCSYEWDILPYYLLRQGTNACPSCKQKHKLDNILAILDTYGLTLVGDYVNSYTPFDVMCKCGRNTFTTTLGALRGGGVKQCAQCDRDDQYNKVASAIATRGCFLISSEYEDCFKPLDIRCACGTSFISTYAHFSDGTNNMCKLCKTNKRDRQVKEYVETHSKCKLINVDRTNSKRKLTLLCQCGNIFETDMSTFKLLNKRRCDKCSVESQGELTIRMYLEDNNYKYKSQFRFADCRHIKPLPFDFGVLNSNGEICALIEYDGEQHFKPIRFNGIDDERALKLHNINQRNQKIKEEYCKQHSYKLLRIPYWDYANIKVILEEFLSNGEGVAD